MADTLDRIDLGEEEGQMQLAGTNMAQIKFVGAAWEVAEAPALGESVQFVVSGYVQEKGTRLLSDDTEREIAKIRVQNVKELE